MAQRLLRRRAGSGSGGTCMPPLTRPTAWLLAALVCASVPAAGGACPDWSNVQLDMPICELHANGWRICDDAPYTTRTSFATLSNCFFRGDRLMIGAARGANAVNVSVLAEVPENVMSFDFDERAATAPSYNIRWAKLPGNLISFSQPPVGGCRSDLLWPLDTGPGEVAGCETGLGTSSEWRKLIFYLSIETCPGNATCVAAQGFHCDSVTGSPILCPLGFTCPGGAGCAATQVPCAPGFHCPGGTEPAVQCTAANTPAGTFCSATQPPGTPCAAGTACPGGAAAPQPCVAGSTWSGPGAGACTQCANVSCVGDACEALLCPAGQFSDCHPTFDSKCVACQDTLCPAGEKRGQCGPFTDANCEPCSNAPDRPADATFLVSEDCEWVCPERTWANGTYNCAECRRPEVCGGAEANADRCMREYQSVCPVGMYRGGCEGSYQVLECRPCTVSGVSNYSSDVVFTSAGIPFDQNNCGWCDSGGGNALREARDNLTNVVAKRWCENVEPEILDFLRPGLARWWRTGFLICFPVLGVLTLLAIFVPALGADNLFFLTRLVCFLTWLAFDLSDMAYRFDWFWSSEDSKLRTFLMPPDDEYAFIGPRYQELDNVSLAALGCRTTLAGAILPQDGLCALFDLPVGVDIMPKGLESTGLSVFEAWTVQGSVGLCLVAYAFVMIQVLFCLLQEGRPDRRGGTKTLAARTRAGLRHVMVLKIVKRVRKKEQGNQVKPQEGEVDWDERAGLHKGKGKKKAKKEEKEEKKRVKRSERKAQEAAAAAAAVAAAEAANGPPNGASPPHMVKETSLLGEESEEEAPVPPPRQASFKRQPSAAAFKSTGSARADKLLHNNSVRNADMGAPLAITNGNGNSNGGGYSPTAAASAAQRKESITITSSDDEDGGGKGVSGGNFGGRGDVFVLVAHTPPRARAVVSGGRFGARGPFMDVPRGAGVRAQSVLACGGGIGSDVEGVLLDGEGESVGGSSAADDDSNGVEFSVRVCGARFGSDGEGEVSDEQPPAADDDSYSVRVCGARFGSDGDKSDEEPRADGNGNGEGFSRVSSSGSLKKGASERALARVPSDRGLKKGPSDKSMGSDKSVGGGGYSASEEGGGLDSDRSSRSNRSVKLKKLKSAKSMMAMESEAASALEAQGQLNSARSAQQPLNPARSSASLRSQKSMRRAQSQRAMSARNNDPLGGLAEEAGGGGGGDDDDVLGLADKDTRVAKKYDNKDKPSSNTPRSMRVRSFWNFLYLSCVSIVVGAQQTCVLLPLTSITANPYCAIMEVPFPRRAGVCFHKWAAVALPPGLILCGLGLPILWWWYRDNKSHRKQGKDRHCFVVIFTDTWFWFRLFIGFVMSVPGVICMTAWFVGGGGVGVWSTFTSVQVMLDLALIKCFAGPAVFIGVALADWFALTVRERIDGMQGVYDREDYASDDEDA